MMGIILAALLSIAVLAGVARLLTAGPLPARLDAVALTVAALAPAALIWAWPVGWAPYLALACAALWFLWRLAAPRTADQGTAGQGTADQGTAGAGRGAAFYRLLFTGAAVWITLSLASSQALGPGRQLGGILLHMVAAVALVFAAAAWLLATFALPGDSAGGDSAGRKIRPAVGLHEALVAGVVALCFFALV